MSLLGKNLDTLIIWGMAFKYTFQKIRVLGGAPIYEYIFNTKCISAFFPLNTLSLVFYLGGPR